MPVLEMTDMNMRGAAFCRYDGAAVFVPGCADGDICEAELSPGGRNYLSGHLVSLITPSPHRCEPDCAVYGECGGCSLRHINYVHELEVKTRAVVQSFRKNGMTVSVSEIRGTSPEKYRNKAIFHNADARLVYYAAESRLPVYPSGGCALLPAEFEDIRVFCEDYFREHSLPFSLGLRMGDGGAVALTVICGENDSVSEPFCAFSAAVSDNFEKIRSVYACFGDPSSPGTPFVRLYGDEQLTVTAGGVKFGVSPSSFFQVNTEGASALCDEVYRMLSPRGGERYADLYCGAGMFALSLAKRCPDARFTGIEINPDAICSAKANAQANAIKSARFLSGDAAAFPKELEGLDGAVVDPPRAGLNAKARRLILKYAPSRIVYVSCNPETLARDVRELSEKYEIADIRCVDMFPRTAHVETVVLMSQKQHTSNGA